jgi:malic enzyme
MRRLHEPFAAIVEGRPVRTTLRGAELLGARLLTKDLAFDERERAELGLHGLLPQRVLTIEEQVSLEHEHLMRKPDALERYIGLAALSDRNATLYYRLLAEEPEEYLPIVYTPTVGLACQQYSHILRRTRGLWLTPDDIDDLDDRLASAPYDDVRLIVVTDNERILGLGDLGAGGMGIPVGKSALYTAAGGIHPSLTLPISLDVGTDNEQLLADPLYLGHRARRLRGPEYDAFIEAFVVAVQRRWPGCVIQWEDFKQGNALRLLDRYRDRVPSFNDDVQGTAAVVLAGILVALRASAGSWRGQRIVMAGAGAAGTGIVRLLRAAMAQDGVPAADVANAIAVTDHLGLVTDDRPGLDPLKAELAMPASIAERLGLRSGSDLAETVAGMRPTILVGATGQHGSFDRHVLHAVASGCDRPVVMALSNPTSAAEATPEVILAATGGRALVATGSPFPPVELAGTRRVVGQANNVFVFPGVGLGALVAEATRITDTMFLAAARSLATLVTGSELETGALYPPVHRLREASRTIAIAVVTEALRAGVAGAPISDPAAAVDAATWWPAYPRFEAADAGVAPHPDVLATTPA